MNVVFAFDASALADFFKDCAGNDVSGAKSFSVGA